MRFGFRRTVTIAVRLVAFAVAMAPLAALFMPWITLDGNQRSYTGVTSVALLVSPIREYLYAVDPVQAAIVTLSPLLIVLLSVVTSSYYYKRRAILWAPPAILAVALAVIYMTADLTNGLHLGPRFVAAVAILLTLHQGAIRLQVATRRNRKLSWASGPLAVATGIEDQRRRR